MEATIANAVKNTAKQAGKQVRMEELRKCIASNSAGRNMASEMALKFRDNAAMAEASPLLWLLQSAGMPEKVSDEMIGFLCGVQSLMVQAARHVDVTALAKWHNERQRAALRESALEE